MRLIIHQIRKHSVLIKGLAFSVFSFFNQAVSFLLLIILARYIAPEEYGMLSLFNTIVMLVGFFIVLSSDGYLSVSFFKSSKEEFPKDVSVILFILVVFLCLFIIIILIFGHYLESVSKLSKVLLLIAVVSSALQVIFNIELNIKRVEEKIWKYGLYSCGFALCNFALSLFLVIGCNLNWLGRIYAQLSCLIVFGVISIYAFKKNSLFTKSISLDRIKTIALWGIPLIPHLATTWLRQGCDRYIVDYYYTIADVGLFSFALNMSSIIEMVGISFNATNSVNIYKVLSNNNLPIVEKKKNLGGITKELFLIYTGSALLIMIGGYFFIPIVLPKYSGSIVYFLILSVYGYFRCLYFVKCNYLFYWDKNKYLMYITFASSVVHLVLSLIITKYSLIFTCFIYCFTQLLIDCLVYYLANRLIKANL